MTDQELLRHYVHDRKEAAFTELVRRHQDMVYSVCLRRLGQAQLAQDAAQLTFLVLLRKAPGLLRHPSLGGWLHRTAFLESRALARKEPLSYQPDAAMIPPAAPTPPDARLDGLDEAMLHLPGRDREALVRRFFEGHTLRELGEASGVSEEAARKRVDRAPDLLTLADDRIATLTDLLEQWEALQQKELDLLEPLLTEEQRPVLRQQVAGRVEFVRTWLQAGTSSPVTTLAPEPPVAARALTDVAGRRLTVPDPAAPATVLIFSSTTCPIANGFAPEIQRLETTYRARGMVFLLVQTEPDLTAAAARQHATDYALTLPILIDPQRVLTKAAGATVTPQAVVLSPTGAVLYRGHIDDRFRAVGQRWSEPRQRGLKDALEAILAGRPVPVPRTDAPGCHIE